MINMVYLHSGKHLFLKKVLPSLRHYYIQGYMGVGDKFLGKEIWGSFPNTKAWINIWISHSCFSFFLKAFIVIFLSFSLIRHSLRHERIFGTRPHFAELRAQHHDSYIIHLFYSDFPNWLVFMCAFSSIQFYHMCRFEHQRHWTKVKTLYITRIPLFGLL